MVISDEIHGGVNGTIKDDGALPLSSGKLNNLIELHCSLQEHNNVEQYPIRLNIPSGSFIRGAVRGFRPRRVREWRGVRYPPHYYSPHDSNHPNNSHVQST